MNDLVERLRQRHGSQYPMPGGPSLFTEAADEIERLRAQVHDLTEAVNIEYVGSVAQARAAALEEAAMVADRLYATTNGIGIAAAIRALREQK